MVDLWRESSSITEKILAAALVVLCAFYQRHLDTARIHRTWFRLVLGLPESDLPVAVHYADASDLSLESDAVDLVLTSPPYINVFNYHQKFRRSVEALEWDVWPSLYSQHPGCGRSDPDLRVTVAPYRQSAELGQHATRCQRRWCPSHSLG